MVQKIVLKEIRSVYKKRRDILISSFKRAGWSFSPPDATMFAWAPIPEKYSDKGSLYFLNSFLKKQELLYLQVLDLENMVINMLELV